MLGKRSNKEVAGLEISGTSWCCVLATRIPQQLMPNKKAKVRKGLWGKARIRKVSESPGGGDSF